MVVVCVCVGGVGGGKNWREGESNEEGQDARGQSKDATITITPPTTKKQKQKTTKKKKREETNKDGQESIRNKGEKINK